VKDAKSVKNVVKVLSLYPGENLLVVVSAMGKTTNAMEQITSAYIDGKNNSLLKQLKNLKKFHSNIINDLFTDATATHNKVNRILELLDDVLSKKPVKNYDKVYDGIVPYGELVSTTIIAQYLVASGIQCTWLDARKVIRTDDCHREARIDWKITTSRIKAFVKKTFKGRSGKQRIVLTQGFIGANAKNHSTTLGREGSDFTAAIFGHVLGAEDVTIWKDVPGVLNADPKWFDETALLPQLSYKDAIELAYYGATVIHPKTIKPLENKKIPLRVKSFLKPRGKGTVINDAVYKKLVASFIFRIDQAVISISVHDFSFIVEENLSLIFDLFARRRVKINVMQNSAISFLVSVDNDKRKLPALVNDLKDHFNVSFTKGKIELITIRYYNQKTIDRVMVKKQLLLEQKGPTTVQLVVKDLA